MFLNIYLFGIVLLYTSGFKYEALRLLHEAYARLRHGCRALVTAQETKIEPKCVNFSTFVGDKDIHLKYLNVCLYFP